MALLQIAEPGQSTVPHQRRLAVGIDLGTTHSLVAAVRSGSAEILPNLQGERLIPSAVRYGKEGLLSVGSAALSAVAEDPLNTLVSLKRLMGRGKADAKALELPYDFSPDSGGVLKVQTASGPVSPVAFSQGPG
jgi:molecular chaperone HscA